jgi:GDP-L-fucose synthase
VVGYSGNLVWNTSKPDGTPRKLMDVGKLHQLGWRHSVELSEGIRQTYEQFAATEAGI